MAAPVVIDASGYDAVNKEWRGSAVADSELKEFYGHWLLEQLSAYPADNIVQINHETGYRMTAQELRAKSLKVAEQLSSQLNLGWADRISVAADHHDDLPALLIGALLKGVVINPLHPGFTMLEFKHFFGLVQPKVIFCETRNLSSIQQALRELDQSAKIVSLDEAELAGDSDLQLKDLVLNWDSQPVTEIPPTFGDPQTELALITCSSGTTGLPKGIRVTHSMVLVGMTNSWPSARDQHVFSTSSLYWGTYQQSLSNMRYGSKRVFTTRSPITVELLLEILEQHRIAHLFVASPMVVALLAALREQPQLRLPYLRQIQATGSIVPEHAYRSLAELLPTVRLNVVYGMSDIAGALSISGMEDYTPDGAERSADLPPLVPGSSGRVDRGTTVRIIGDVGRRCGPNEEGEVYGRKVYRLGGYLNNEVTTRGAIDEEGFLRTGDIGRFDREGRLFVVDRRKDFFKHSGFAISPTEVEQFIEGRFPGSVQVAVVVGIPDEAVMCLPAAVIVRRKGAQLRAEEVQQAVAEGLSDAKRLRGGVYFVDELPRTFSNKVQRNVVLQMAEKWCREGGQA